MKDKKIKRPKTSTPTPAEIPTTHSQRVTAQDKTDLHISRDAELGVQLAKLVAKKAWKCRQGSSASTFLAQCHAAYMRGHPIAASPQRDQRMW